MEYVLLPVVVLKTCGIRARICLCTIIDFTPIKDISCRLEARAATCISHCMFPSPNKTSVADKSERRRFLRRSKRYRPKVAGTDTGSLPSVADRPTESAAVVDLAVTQLLSQR